MSSLSSSVEQVIPGSAELFFSVFGHTDFNKKQDIQVDYALFLESILRFLIILTLPLFSETFYLR